MRCYASPYAGDQDFIFFSYCHDDAAKVYPVIERLELEGFRVWFDDGIHAGEDWPEVIAQHMNRAKVCVAAISKSSAESHNCRNEVNFAISHNIPFLSVILEDFRMPLGIQLQLSSTRYLRKYELPEESFYETLLTAPSLALCRESSRSADAASLERWQRHKEMYIHDASQKSEEQLVDDTLRRWFTKGKKVNEAEDDAARKAQEEAELMAHEAAQKAREEAERKAREEAERKAREEAERKAREEAERKAREEAERKVWEEAERKAREEAERKAREEAERKAGEEAERKAREEAERKAREEAERKAREEQKRKAATDSDDDHTIIIEEGVTEDSGDATVLGIRYYPALFVRMKTGEAFHLKKNKTVIGRKSIKSDIVIPDNPGISGDHIAIIRDGKKFLLKNLNPTNETIVNGLELAKDGTIELLPGSEIMLSDEQFFLIYGDAYDRVFDEQKICLLRCRETDETKLLTDDFFPLDRNHTWRNGILNDRSIHRNAHAEIYREHGRLYLRDLESRNGTFLNGKRLEPNIGMELHDGDKIAVVDTEFIYCESKIGG